MFSYCKLHKDPFYFYKKGKLFSRVSGTKKYLIEIDPAFNEYFFTVRFFHEFNRRERSTGVNYQYIRS